MTADVFDVDGWTGGSRYPQSGEMFGRYRIDHRLGQGAMGVVFAATQMDLGRTVALKVLAPGLADEEEYQNRFVREAEALARVDSPHIVQVFEAGTAHDWQYLVMQYVAGGDFRDLMSEGPVTLDAALAIVRGVATGLDDAHSVGVLHRDVKPSNILLRRSSKGLPHAYVADFGIAQTVGAEVTRTGGVIGSPAYMPPERHDGGSATVQGDVYSLGCVLWAALTGHQPYDGTDMQVAMAHLHQPLPQLDARFDDCSAEARDALNDVLVTAMAKDPEARFETAAAFREALGRVSPRVATPPLLANAGAAVDAGPVPTVFSPHPASREEVAPVGPTFVPAQRSVVADDVRPVPNPALAEAAETEVRHVSPAMLTSTPQRSGQSTEGPKPVSRRPRKVLGALVVVVVGLVLAAGVLKWLGLTPAFDSQDRAVTAAASSMPRGTWVLTKQVISSNANESNTDLVFGEKVGHSGHAVFSFAACETSSWCTGHLTAGQKDYRYRWDGHSLEVTPTPLPGNTVSCAESGTKKPIPGSWVTRRSTRPTFPMHVVSRSASGRPTALSGDSTWTYSYKPVADCRLAQSHYQVTERWTMRPKTD